MREQRQKIRRLPRPLPEWRRSCAHCGSIDAFTLAAYALGREDYLLTTWHYGTRPASLELASEPRSKWLGLEVRRYEQLEPDHAVVEFVARYKMGGRAHRLHEISRFMREAERWFYVDGDPL